MLLRSSLLCTATLCGFLTGCSKPDNSGPAHTAFASLAGTCTTFLAARTPYVHQREDGQWMQTGYSPAQLSAEVDATESTVTPFVGKLVIKDNEAQAQASDEAQARAVVLTPAHLLSNRTHTLIYRYDGQRWHWENGQRLTKTPGHNDAITALTHADVQKPGSAGFAGCVPG